MNRQDNHHESHQPEGEPPGSNPELNVKTPGLGALEDAGYQMVYGLLTLRNEERN